MKIIWPTFDFVAKNYFVEVQTDASYDIDQLNSRESLLSKIKELKMKGKVVKID